MLFNESDAPHLKAWIVGRLANDSDADADVLADYVLALLRHDDTAENIRKMFDEEIPDFLREGATAFNDDVFQAVKYKSYIPGAPPAPPVIRQPPPQIRNQPYQRPDSQYQPEAPFVQNPGFPPFSSTGSRKRAYNDRDDDNDVSFILDSRDPYHPAQPYKQPRRGRDFAPRGGRLDDSYGMRGPRGGPNHYQQPPGPSIGQYGQPPAYPPYPHAQNLPPVDPNSILENIQRLQQLGIPIPPASDLPRPVYSGSAIPPPRRRKGRCRDYDTKGYCSRGSRCMFEHGSESVYVPSFGPSPADEYDPHNASLPLSHFGLPPQSQIIPPLDMSPLQAAPPNRQEFKRQKRPPKGRAPIAANGPVHDRTKSTIVVQNIPAEHFADADIRGYFGQFGNIMEVTMQEDSRLAIIKFESWDAANAAWSSPKVIFDNRFVKVFWYKDDVDAASQGLKGKPANGTRNGVSNGEAPTDENKEPEFDMDEFLRKQKEAQKAHEEKTQKRQEIEKERQALEDRQKELLARQQEEKRKLQAKLAAKGADGRSLSPADTKTSTPGEKPSTQAEALRAQLAALEEEANSLGIDPDAQDESSSWFPRGRGRGRGVYRGRGGFPPRAAYRGSHGYRGRGGGNEARYTAYAAYSLDLRPKIIAITGADFAVPEKEEALRQHLFGVGEFKEIHIDPATTHITFKDRKTAEQFMFGVTAAGKNQIPGIEEKLELTWSSTAPGTEQSNNNAATTSTGDDGDALMASGLEDAAAAAATAAAASKEKAGIEDVDAGTTAIGDLEDGEVDEGGGDDMDYEGIF